MAFTLNPLPYAYDALEPYIDSKTLEIHHWAHHKTYLDKFNAAIVWTEYEGWSLEDILRKLDSLPDNIRNIVRNNWWGYYNHNIYFGNMTPGGAQISDEMKSLIERDFGSFEKFKEDFSNVAVTTFGSGRACLAKDWDKLVMYSLPNQDTALMKGHVPLLMLDVWEHAYYLKHQNKRPQYINDWWGVVNWNNVLDLYKNYNP